METLIRLQDFISAKNLPQYGIAIYTYIKNNIEESEIISCNDRNQIFTITVKVAWDNDKYPY